jgi:hypothetical protein
MTINEHAEEVAGLPVRDYEPGRGLPDAARTAWRLTLGLDAFDSTEPLTDLIASFVEETDAKEVRAVVIGAWEEMGSGTSSQGIVEALAAARGQLRALETIFFGDVVVEESEISWIVNSDMGPLLAAYPRLQQLRVRGGQELSFGNLRHESLRALIVETGGLSGQVVRQVAAADLPALTHLELWLGDSGYGADWRMEELAPILSGQRFPRLATLGLRNCERADELAAAVAAAPILERIQVLDLSLGTLGDAGAEALLGAPPVRRLRRLDLHHHYLSDAMMQRLERLGIDVDVSDKQDADSHDGVDERYVAVSE